MTKVKLGIYEHYKGGRYEIFGEGVNTETGEEYVVYKPLYEVPDPEKFRLRPKGMFVENVVIEGKEVPRFKFIEK